MRIKIIYILLCMFAIFSCKNKDKVNLNEVKVERIAVPDRQNFFSFIDTLQTYDLNFLKQAVDKDAISWENCVNSYIEVTAKHDSIPIKKVSFEGKNLNFSVSLADTLRQYNVHIEKPILKGGSIYQTLTDFGMKPKHIGFYAWKMGEYIDATSIDIGDIFTIDYQLDSLNTKNFHKFSYKPDKTSIHEFTLLAERELGYKLIELPFELQRRYLTGEITKENPTLDAALAKLGLIPYIRQQANNALESQIAFSTDARVGDKFEVYVEEKYVNGELQPRGKMVYVEYSGKYTKTKSAYRFLDKEKASAYSGMYTKKGKRLVSNAVRTPLNRMHISSAFGYRIHPVTGRRKMHNGIDLRGSRGTPIYAITSGRVIKATNSGNGYGKEVRIRHSNGMISQYAHMSRISTRRGRNVKKGQIIGRVGTTGVSTGPHLHFGIRRGKRWVNPKTNIRMVGANKLSGKRKTRFFEQVKQIDQEIANLTTKNTTEVASVKSEKKETNK